MTPFSEGLTATLRYRVQQRDLASAWGNAFPVLATPILLWLSELVCMKAVEGCIATDQITLGLGHNSRHIGASLEGAEIAVSAVLKAWAEKTLEFTVQAHDRSRLVMEGIHTRALLQRDRFEQKLTALRVHAT
jgi:fluoroacetyl-CoA thioesterase